MRKQTADGSEMDRILNDIYYLTDFNMYIYKAIWLSMMSKYILNILGTTKMVGVQ